MEKDYFYEVGVVGAGLAGCEAAISAAKMKRRTLLITINLDTAGNLAGDNLFGGDQKDQLIKEIGELGGYLPENIKTNLIFEGPGLNQKIIHLVDRRNFFLKAKHYLEERRNLTVRQGEVIEIIPQEKGLAVQTRNGESFKCKTVVLCPGTFIGAKIIWGNSYLDGGRYGEIKAKPLVKCLDKNKLLGNYHWVETAPRLNGSSLDFSRLEIIEPSDSIENQENSFKVSLNNGILKEILDKVKTDADNDKYGCFSSIKKRLEDNKKKQIDFFIRAEGLKTEEVYLEGARMSYPVDIQQEIINSIYGLEKAIISRPGYRVKYRVIDTKRLKPTLETKPIEGLFTAGQINGTSGYEEAAAQGLMAGINAALKARGEPAFILDRSQAYIGVLIDDLVTKGVDEPYRMFTSRAEHRLLLRTDNADLRLAHYGQKYGLLKGENQESFSRET